MPTSPVRRARRPQLERETPLVPIAAARSVLEEASLWLGAPLPRRYAAGLAHRAKMIYAHSALFRKKIRRTGDAGRDCLCLFMRHWLAARLHKERPAIFARLPKSYCAGKPLPSRGPIK